MESFFVKKKCAKNRRKHFLTSVNLDFLPYEPVQLPDQLVCNCPDSTRYLTQFHFSTKKMLLVTDFAETFTFVSIFGFLSKIAINFTLLQPTLLSWYEIACIVFMSSISRCHKIMMIKISKIIIHHHHRHLSLFEDKGF